MNGVGDTYVYDALRKAGLRVQIRNRFTATTLADTLAYHQSPRAGARVKAGGVVKITLGWGPINSMPCSGDPVKVPDFTHRPMSAMTSWAERHDTYSGGCVGMQWLVKGKLPALPPSSRPHLFDNYVIFRQDPAAGARLAPGVRTKSGGVHVTPLLIWVKLRRH